jgi:hypothetical protein
MNKPGILIHTLLHNVRKLLYLLFLYEYKVQECLISLRDINKIQ